MRELKYCEICGTVYFLEGEHQYCSNPMGIDAYEKILICGQALTNLPPEAMNVKFAGNKDKMEKLKKGIKKRPEE